MLKKKSWVWRGLVLALVAVVAIPVFVLGPFYFRLKHVQAEPTAGYWADFYVYVSPGAKKAAQRGDSVFVLVQPNNSGTNSDDPEVHLKDAWWTSFGRHGLANELDVVLLVPAFVRPSEDWHIYTHALDKDALTTEREDLGRPDLQLLAMLRKTRTILDQSDIHVREKILLQGYSASGMFANRFATIHPKRVLAVAAGSPGGWPLAPVTQQNNMELPYPIGVADLQALTGSPFDSTSYALIHQLLVMGSFDDNDSVDFGDGWDTEHASIVDSLFGETPIERWEASKLIYKQQTSRASFVLVDGVGHDRRALQYLSTAFFKDVLAEYELLNRR